VAEVEVLVTRPKPTHRIIHPRDLHWAAKADFGVGLSTTLGRPVVGEELDLRHEELFLQAELVQAEQFALLRCLVKHHELQRVLGACLTARAVADFHKRLAEVRAIDAGLARLKKQRAALPGEAPDIDKGIAELVQGRRGMLSEYGAAGRVALEGLAERLPLEEEPLPDATYPVGPDGTVRLNLDKEMEARHDAEVKAALASGPVALGVLGAWHDLSARVRRLGGGTVGYLRMTTGAVERSAGKG
jgi:hypothetical protein